MTQENATGKNPAADVVDKGANLKITDVQMFHVGKLYVRIQTNAGITGWGETYGLIPKAAIELCAAMGEGIKGMEGASREAVTPHRHDDRSSHDASTPRMSTSTLATPTNQ